MALSLSNATHLQKQATNKLKNVASLLAKSVFVFVFDEETKKSTET
jgi:hypothetical protein